MSKENTPKPDADKGQPKTGPSLYELCADAATALQSARIHTNLKSGDSGRELTDKDVLAHIGVSADDLDKWKRGVNGTISGKILAILDTHTQHPEQSKLKFRPEDADTIREACVAYLDHMNQGDAAAGATSEEAKPRAKPSTPKQRLAALNTIDSQWHTGVPSHMRAAELLKLFMEKLDYTPDSLALACQKKTKLKLTGGMMEGYLRGDPIISVARTALMETMQIPSPHKETFQDTCIRSGEARSRLPAQPAALKTTEEKPPEKDYSLAGLMQNGRGTDVANLAQQMRHHMARLNPPSAPPSVAQITGYLSGNPIPEPHAKGFMGVFNLESQDEQQKFRAANSAAMRSAQAGAIIRPGDAHAAQQGVRKDDEPKKIG